MGDIVQKSLEELIPVFENLEQIQLFTPHELKYIIRKCKSFEYKIIRKMEQKTVFVAYIQYLFDFSQLIFRRRKVTKCWNNKEEIERSLSRKIESLFRAACNRFKSDVNLWLSRINFAKKKTLYINVSKLYFALLQVHPNKPNLWISAAKFEFEDKNNVDSARNIMQRGLRFNPKSEKLWLELFRMELLFIEKLLKRRMILNEEKSPQVDDTEDAIVQGKLAILVFRHAIQEIKEAEFCLKFVEIAKHFPFAVSITEKIYNFLSEHFSESEETYECLISLHFSKGMNDILNRDPPLDIVEKSTLVEQLENQCYHMYKDAALKKINTKKMWTLYLNFCINRYSLLPEKIQNEKFGDLHAKFMEAAESTENVLSLEMCQKWIDLCPTNDQRELALLKSIDKYPKSIELRLVYLKLVIEIKEEDRKFVMKAFNSAVTQMSEKESLPLWKLALEWSLIKHPKKVKKFFEKSFAADYTIASQMKLMYLDWLLMTSLDFAATVRQEFKRLCLMKPNSAEFYETYVKMELASPEPCLTAIRQCYENAVFEHGQQNVDLWTSYFKFESQASACGTSGSTNAAYEASKVYSRAVKTLNGPLVEQFIRQNVIKH